MESVAIEGNVRSDLGKKGTKAIRKEGNAPCVIYGGEKVIHFSAPAKAFKTLVYSPDFKLVKITVDGKSYDCILKSVQFHPVSEIIEHIDFLELVSGNTVKVDIPIRFRGTAPGVKKGGKLTPKLRRVKVKTTPESLTDALYVDVSNLMLGSSVRVKDIEITDDMEVMNSAGIPVASVEIPRALRSAEAAAGKDGEEDLAEDAEGAEGGETGEKEDTKE